MAFLARFALPPVTKTFRRHGLHRSSFLRLSSNLKPQARFKAVVFDLGGVIIPSPLPLIAEFEKKHGLLVGSVNATIRHFGGKGSFARLERGELTLEDFCQPFAEEYSSFNSVSVSKERMWDLARYLAGLEGPGLIPFKEMINVIERLNRNGIKTAVLTNNFKFNNGTTVLPNEELAVDLVNDQSLLNGSFIGGRIFFFFFQFQVFQSCIEGINKPDVNIYRMVSERLGIRPTEAVFLDDIGRNLKAARSLGMETIKVIITLFQLRLYTYYILLYWYCYRLIIFKEQLKAS